MAYELQGSIKLIYDLQTFPSGFSKREFVVTTTADRFPQDVKFECVKEKTSMLDGLNVGDPVNVFFDVRGNEFKEKYYVNLVAGRWSHWAPLAMSRARSAVVAAAKALAQGRRQSLQEVISTKTPTIPSRFSLV